MSFFSRFPYTDFHRLNADWILDKIKEAVTSVTEALGLVRQSAADAASAAAAAQQAVDGSVRYDQSQTLTGDQQRQAQSNMNVVDASVVARLDLAVSNLNTAVAAISNAGFVRYDQSQSLNTDQQRQAQSNMNVVDASVVARLDLAVSNLNTAVAAISNAGFVRYDQSQSLNTDQQSTAMGNIGAASSTDVSNLSVNLQATNIALNNTRIIAQAAQARADIALIYEEQELTGAQQAVARSNIGCAPTASPEFTGSVALKSQSLPTAAADDIIDMYNATLVNDTNSRLQLTGSVGQSVTVSGVASPTANDDAANKSYVDGRITANAPLLVQFTGSDDEGNAACNRNYNEIHNALFNNRAVHMVCVVGQMQYDLIPTRNTGSPQSVGGHVISVGGITNTGALDSYITISCSISATDRVSVQIVDNM